MPRAYWDYDSVNIQWGVLENYEVVRKIGWVFLFFRACCFPNLALLTHSLV